MAISASLSQSLQQFSRGRGWTKGPKCGRPHAQFGRGIQNFYDFLTFADGEGERSDFRGFCVDFLYVCSPLHKFAKILNVSIQWGWIKINFNISRTISRMNIRADLSLLIKQKIFWPRTNTSWEQNLKETLIMTTEQEDLPTRLGEEKLITSLSEKWQKNKDVTLDLSFVIIRQRRKIANGGNKNLLLIKTQTVKSGAPNQV